MPQGRDQILFSPGRNIDGNLPRKNNNDMYIPTKSLYNPEGVGVRASNQPFLGRPNFETNLI